MQVLKRPFFTLIEMLVVLLILSTGMALTGVKIKQAFDEQRKLSDIQQVLNTLIMAQDLMLIMDADVEVVFSHDRETKRVVCQIFVEKLVEESWAKVVERPLKLAVIRSFDFTGRAEDPLHLRFTLGKMSQGTLRLSTDEHVRHGSSDKNDFKIFLAGYPSPITKTMNEEHDIEQAQSSEQLYPNEVQEDLLTKINK